VRRCVARRRAEAVRTTGPVGTRIALLPALALPAAPASQAAERTLNAASVEALPVEIRPQWPPPFASTQ
jgi:hypothetical protein